MTAILIMLGSASVEAAPFKDFELAMRSYDAYLSEKTYKTSKYRELAELNDKKLGVQALALERLKDNVVVVAYAGTEASDVGDILADLGLTGKEIQYAVHGAIYKLASFFEDKKIIGKGKAEVVRNALAGDFGGLKISKSRATSKGKPARGCARGSFFDPRKGGECWSCPSSTKRTLHPVTNAKACVKSAYKIFKKASKVRKNKRIGQGCPKGQFWDIKGGKGLLGACYQCPSDYRRTTRAVDHNEACARSVSAQNKKAAFISKASCPKGTFFDLVDGGSCWSCPAGYARSVTSVKAAGACYDISWEKEADSLFNAGFKVNGATEIQLKMARAFVKSVLKLKNSRGQKITTQSMILTGHSLGGFIAQIVAAENNIRAVTINAPGAKHYKTSLSSKKIRNLRRRHDPVGQLGKHIGEEILYDDVSFNFKKDILKGNAYLGRNHSVVEFIATLIKKGQ